MRRSTLVIYQLFLGSLAARTSIFSMTGCCARSSGDLAINAAATRPPRWASRPASSGNASKMPNVDGPRRGENHATVAGSSRTTGRAPHRRFSTPSLSRASPPDVQKALCEPCCTSILAWSDLYSLRLIAPATRHLKSRRGDSLAGAAVKAVTFSLCVADCRGRLCPFFLRTRG